jgi:hypothetical protein
MNKFVIKAMGNEVPNLEIRSTIEVDMLIVELLFPYIITCIKPNLSPKAFSKIHFNTYPCKGHALLLL